jgi:hypothetical protein
MTKDNFHDIQKKSQITWRKGNILSTELGCHCGKKYEHIIPSECWRETLWYEIRGELPKYLSKNNIQSHRDTNNLLSSWILSANLYYIVNINSSFKKLMLGFLQQHISEKITNIVEVELEFAFNGELSPKEILGEQGGKRGFGQTSPDVAFIIDKGNGKGIIFTECKYTEPSFYQCSARSTKSTKRRKANPDPKRCINKAKACNYKNICHQTVWRRKYWNNLTLSKYGEEILTRCPAYTSGDQLFRQQSLAEGIAKTNIYDLVVSSVAFDGRNNSLINCLKATGIKDFTDGWDKLFTGNALFRTWTHQEWVEYVRVNGTESIHQEWVNYLNKRYGY